MKYRFEAFDGAGNLVVGEIEAGSADEARALVQARGPTPFAVREAGAFDLLFKDIRLEMPGGKAADAALARLARDLAVLLQADVPLDAALRIASATAEDRRMRDLALRMREGILRGVSLGEVMEGMPDAFRPDYVRIVQAGDVSADLGAAMQDLADLLDRRVEIRARVRSALAYPTLLVGLAAVSLWIVLGLLVPAVTPIFRESGLELPGILAVLDGLRERSGTILGLVAGLLGALGLALILARRSPGFRRRLDRLLLALPVTGRIAETREAARFTRTFATLIKAGVAPLQALQTACALVHNSFTRGQLETTVTDVRAGSTIGAAMERAGALPLAARHMITVGEESGRLRDMLLRAALILERQDQTQTARLLAILTPTVTVLVSGMIAAVILSVMSAILSINDLALQ
ncbi:type II secretion system F family protein [Methylobacterium durans]|uniref:type II secretion system F family protein n=1 Tax=Methylobacterium durans TaxID=2202825 RepID=UPI002AFE2393|nr:type II secretion system F family protein [Methylobacterium durans]MEA1833475.1 type II secretion system F family protein [Methylobacterium durans]